MAVEVLRAPGLMDSGPLAMPPAPQMAGYFADFNAPQEYLQSQRPSLRPKEQRKWQGKRRGGAGAKRKRQASGSGAGQHPNAPSLKALQQNNAKGARRHFSHRKEEVPNAVTPRTVPHAPLNTTGFLMAQNGQRTPTALRRTGAGEEVENLDFFGTNDGLVLREDSPSATWDEDQSSDDSDSDTGEPDDKREEGEARAQARPQDQTAYIMSLEQQNLHLKEANLNLQEKCYILEQRLKDMEQQQQGQQHCEEGEELTEPCPMLSEGPAAEDAATLDDGSSIARRTSWEES